MTIVRGRDLTDGFTESCDVVVVGSGAGGAVFARIAAEAGRDVIVLEEGGYYAPEEYGRFRPSESLARLGREGGMSAAIGLGDTPLIVVNMGRAVGGSSLWTGAVCFRIPDRVLDEWVREHGLTDLSPRHMESAFEEVERNLEVQEVPAAMISRSSALFAEGGRQMGVEFARLRRNTVGCDGCSRCTFGCPHGAKRSVDLSYLPQAREHGAVVYSDCLVERVVVERERAVGVRGRILGPPQGRPTHRFEVRAKLVVVACGTLHTPKLLATAGVGRASRQLGRNVTLHPGFRVTALFDEEVLGWRGAMQSITSDHFHEEGILLNSVYSAPSVLAAGMPGVGPTLARYARQMRHVAVFGGMVHDSAGGTIRSIPFSREPAVFYRMDPRDKARGIRAIALLAEMAFLAGAREVMIPMFGAPPIRTMDDVRRFASSAPPGPRLECFSQHPLGSARMATDALRGVVSSRGETFELGGLVVADGSVVPSSLGVNSQVPVMAMATRIAHLAMEDWRRHAA